MLKLMYDHLPHSMIRPSREGHWEMEADSKGVSVEKIVLMGLL